MRPAASGFRLAVVGASSLLGKELLTVLEERQFPISRLVKFEADEEEPDPPTVNLQAHSQAALTDADVTGAELDFAFFAARPRRRPIFLRPQADARCIVIDLGDSLEETPRGTLSVPALEQPADSLLDLLETERREGDAKVFVGAHPAAIILSRLVSRLASRFELRSSVATIFGPASEIGAQAIEELQKQTVSLLSFQKIPSSIFGAQLAFNMLPRLGREGVRTVHSSFANLETRIRRQVRALLAGRSPLPAVRLLQVPVFYSLALSIYVETAQPVAAPAVGEALAGAEHAPSTSGRRRPGTADSIRLRRLTDPAPTQVEATNSDDILVDAIRPDSEHPNGIWIWATADNLRVAAVNAVEIAESLIQRKGQR